YVALPTGRLKFVYPPDRGPWRRTGWSGQKVLWVASRSYSGPVLIRGGQIDGSNALGFDFGRDPHPWSELQLPPALHRDLRLNGGWRYWASYSRLRAPGCYAYQVDGTNFSYVIVFRAVATH